MPDCIGNLETIEDIFSEICAGIITENSKNES